MSEITDLLQQKAGLTPEQSQVVEQIVVAHLMSRVPSQFQGMLSSALGTSAPAAEGQPAESGGLGGLLGQAEGFFGSKG